MQIIYTTIVGSKMHGLDTPNSDEDIRHITRHSIRDVLSPFKNESIKVNSNGEDVESWEMCHFVKHMTQGNPTCYEVIKSPLYDKSMPFAEIIRGMLPLFFDGRKILMAHLGYADAQLKRYLNKVVIDGGDIYKQYEENFLRRIPKSTVAAHRVIAQATQLLKTGDFVPVVSEYSPRLHEQLMTIKQIDVSDITLKWVIEQRDDIERKCQGLKEEFDMLAPEIRERKPNISAIEDVLANIYGISGIN